MYMHREQTRGKELREQRRIEPAVSIEREETRKRSRASTHLSLDGLTDHRHHRLEVLLEQFVANRGMRLVHATSHVWIHRAPMLPEHAVFDMLMGPSVLVERLERLDRRGVIAEPATDCEKVRGRH